MAGGPARIVSTSSWAGGGGIVFQSGAVKPQLSEFPLHPLFELFSSEFSNDARSKGLAEARVILKYPVRVALNPFASTIGYTLPYIVSGSIIVSLVLSLPTVGPLLLKALVAQDMFLAGTIVLLLGVLTVVGTFLSDLLLLWIDPRIRMEGKR